MGGRPFLLKRKAVFIVKFSYDGLTKYINHFENTNFFGEWIIDRENDGSTDHPKQMPFVNYSRIVDSFIDDVYHFVDENRDLGLNHYYDVLTENHLEWGLESTKSADVSSMDGQCVMALIVGAIRAERFCDGALLDFFKNGYIVKWLKRLNQIQKLQ